jgi:DNA polymerase III subunit alpha
LLTFTIYRHSTFSHGDGHGTPKAHVERAAELGYKAISLSEHGGVSSHFQLEKYAIAAGIKPIFGLEAYCGSTDLETRQQFKNHLTVIARTNEGYRNLNRIVTQSYVDYYYHPTVSGSSLIANREGLAILSGCTGSLLACSLVGGKGIPEPANRSGYAWDDARHVISRFRNAFGENYFIEVQPFYELEKTNKINTAYEILSREMGVPLAVTCDVHYPRPEDSEMQAILHAVHRGSESVDDQLRSWNYDVPMTLPESDEALAERLIKTGLSKTGAWEAIMNTEVLAERCNVTLPKAERLVYPMSQDDLRPWK